MIYVINVYIFLLEYNTNPQPCQSPKPTNLLLIFLYLCILKFFRIFILVIDKYVFM